MNDDHKTHSDPKTDEHHDGDRHEEHTDTHEKTDEPATPSTDAHKE